jgi:plastocyanin
MRPRLAKTMWAAMTAAAIAAAAPALAPPLAAEEVTGRLTLLARDGKSLARDADARLAVVYFEPAAGGAGAGKAAGTFQLIASHRQLIPHVLAIPVGSRVQFRNQDATPHSLFSASPGNAFDLGVVGAGAARERRFEQAGLVRVYCNLHQGMAAYLLVLDTPFYAMPAADGSFRLTGLPKGDGKLVVWQEQADPWSMDLSLPQQRGAPPVQARLVVTRPKPSPHLNKLGQPYPRGEAHR